MRRIARTAPIAICMLVSSIYAGSAAAADLANGDYRCEMINAAADAGDADSVQAVYIGDISIADGSYKGPGEDDAQGDSHDFDVTDAEEIIWNGPLGSLTRDGSQVLGTTLWTSDDGEQNGFDITVKLPGGDQHVVNCRPD